MNSKNWYEIAKEKASKFLDGETRLYSDDVIITSRVNNGEKGQPEKNMICFMLKGLGLQIIQQ